MSAPSLFCTRSHFELKITPSGRCHQYLHFPVETVKAAGPVCSSAMSAGLALAGEDAASAAQGQGFWNRPLLSLFSAHGGNSLVTPCVAVWALLALVVFAFFVSFDL